LTVKHTFCGLSPELALFLLWQDDLNTSEESLPLSQCSFKEYVLALVIYILVKTLSWWGVTRFAQPCICTDALSVLLSALYLYCLPRVLIQRRMHTSGAGSSLFCALTVE
jgi:hypothetical protein